MTKDTGPVKVAGEKHGLNPVQRLQERIGVKPDGAFGPVSKAALIDKLTGPTDRLTEADIETAAARLGLSPAHVGAVYDVESRGRGMSDAGLPIILYEPHVFSRETKRVHDARHHTISYRAWRTLPYPKTQSERWGQLLNAVALDPDAGFRSASYGLFQIMGFNSLACGFDTPYDFVLAMGAGEASQLLTFCAYIENAGLKSRLAAKDWTRFARAYNGPAFEENRYHEKLAAAYARRGGR